MKSKIKFINSHYHQIKFKINQNIFGFCALINQKAIL